MKKRLSVVLLICVMLVVSIALVACSEGESPIKSIEVTSMPITKYYVGDTFNLNDAKLTVYYENGTVRTIPIDYSMISSFDSNVVGDDQILTVMYNGAVTQIKVSVALPPIYSVRVEDGDYKKTYVVGQALNLSNVFLTVTYTNNHVDRIPVTEDMIDTFDSTTAGEKDVVVKYRGYTPTFRVNVVPKSIRTVDFEEPDKQRYVVGEKIDFTGSRIFLAYNNNTQTYVEAVTLLNDPNFKVFIDGVETDVFTKQGTSYITVSYYGILSNTAFDVRVSEVKATKIEWAKEIVDGVEREKTIKPQARHSAEPDLSGAAVTVEYNNGVVEELLLTDDKITIDWKEFDINTSNDSYKIAIETGGLEMEAYVSVVEPVEKELIVYLPQDVSYYQDGPEIDLTQWSYSLVLTNGEYMTFGDSGLTRRYFTTKEDGSLEDYGLFDEQPDVSTTTAGERTYRFTHVSTDLLITLHQSVTFTIHERVLTDYADFVLPEKSVYYPGEELDLTGGSFLPVYNDGRRGDVVFLTSDMPVDGLSGYTTAVGTSHVVLRYTDPTYAGTIEFGFDITVVKAATELAYSENLSVGLKTSYVLGEEFISDKLVVKLTYSDQTHVNVTSFTGKEWSFAGTVFDEVGETYVTLYYGDLSGSAIFTRIPVVVTNDVSSVTFREGFTDFGEVVEGTDITVPTDAVLVITRQNGAVSEVPVQKSMLDYRSADTTLGARVVKVTYDAFILDSSVLVTARSIESVEIYSEPDCLSYVKSSAALDVTGLILRAFYDNGTILEIKDSDMTYVGVSSGVVTYTATVSGRALTISFDEIDVDFTSSYNRQTIAFSVTDANAAGEGKGNEFDIYCFTKLISELTFGTNTDGDGATVYVNEAEELVFPADAYIKVTYSDDSVENDALSDVMDEITVIGYDKNTAGMQQVTIEYLLNECSVLVYVRGKVLKDVSVTPASPAYVSLIEGVPLSSDVLSVRLHFVKHDGTEYSPVYYSDVEFGNVKSCTYDHNADFQFNLLDNGSAYCEDEYSLTYAYGAVEESASFRVRTYKRKAVSVTMQVLPRSEYIEGADAISLYTKDGEPGRLLVTYDNGVSVRYDLDNNLVSVNSSGFDGSEIAQGSAPRRQRIVVTFHDGNNQISTEYYVTVKDREYLTVDYSRNPTDGIYTFRYGADGTNRPAFTVQGYAPNAIDELVLTTLATTQSGALFIDDLADFDTYYVDENHVQSHDFPKEVGLYTVVITYVGDAYNNELYEDSRKIRILPKELTLTMSDKQVVYGEGYDALTVLSVDGLGAVYTWTVTDDDENEGAAALAYAGETLDGILSLTCAIYRNNEPFTFYSYPAPSTRTLYVSSSLGATVVGEYEIRPIIDVNDLSPNYSIKSTVSGTLTVAQKPIKIVANAVEKVYGANDPRLNDYTVYDAGDNAIGGAGVINLDGGDYEDSVANYTLYRSRGEEYEQVGSYTILNGSASGIANYSLISYQSAQLTITKKSITLVGQQTATRYYGHGAPIGDDYQEYAFALKTGSTLERGDDFDSVFDFLIDYRAGAAADKLTISIGTDSTELDADADAGIYTVHTTIAPSAVHNYNVTVEDFSFTVTAESIIVALHSYSVDYLTYADAYWAEKANWAAMSYDDAYESLLYDQPPYDLTYTDGFILDDEVGFIPPVFGVLKEKGYDVGRYRLILNPDDVSANYSVTVTGDFGAFVAEEMDEEYLSALGTISEEVRQNAYLVIKPHRFDFTRALSEEYARKQTVRPEITVDYDYDLGTGEFRDFILTQQETFLAAFTFTLTNDHLDRANFGYYTVDTYSGIMRYDYFANAAGKNYYPSDNGSDLSAESMAAIYRYAYTGVSTPSVTSVLTEAFSFEITPIVLDIVITNTDSTYTDARTLVNGKEAPLAVEITLQDYSVCAGDVLSIAYDISVKYYRTEEFVATDMVYHSGDYKVFVSDLGNVNYAMSDLSNDSADNVATFTVSPITLDVYIPAADENGYVHKTYNGRPVRTANMNWQAVLSSSDVNGYYKTSDGSFIVVNDAGLASAPKNLRIDPVYYENEIAVNPTNASQLDEHDNVVPYEYVFSTPNDAHENISVRFVKHNPAYNGNNDRYVETTYGLVIDKKEVRLGNLVNGGVNVKDYDGRVPQIVNVDSIIVDGDVSADPIDKTRLVFSSFARDMSHVPESLRTVVTEEDLTSAGYFTFEISYTNASGFSNYSFLPETDRFIIRRINVEINLNGNDNDLQKEFDTLAPSATKSDFRTLASVADDVYIELDSKFFRASSLVSWSAFDENAGNNVGQYAYDFKTYARKDGEDLIVNGDRVYYSDYVDETYGTHLLSNNYCYYITYVSGLNSNDCDGVFYVNQKAVSIYLPGGTDNGVNYVYPKTFSTQSITAAAASAELNAGYKIYDKTGELSEERLSLLGFRSVDGTKEEAGDIVRDKKSDLVAGGADIQSAGQSFSVSFSALSAANPNFRITNKPILYSIVKLEVGLDLYYFNANDDAEMVYGTVIMDAGSGINYRVFDFHDKEAFAESIGKTASEVGDVSTWITDNEAYIYDYTKFVLYSSATFYLTNSFNSYNLSEKTIIDAGTYSTFVTGFYSENYTIKIYPQSFVIKQKPISISGASRDYFDKTDSLQIDWSIDGNVRKAVEDRLISLLLGCFVDDTALNAGAGDYSGHSDYFVYALRTDVNDIVTLYPNYTLDVDDLSNGVGQQLKLKLTINKIPLSVGMRASDENSVLSISYGQDISLGGYALTYAGFPAISRQEAEREGYNYDTEYGYQTAVKNSILNNILDIPALANKMKVLSVDENAYNDDTYQLANNLQSGLPGDVLTSYLDNYYVEFEDFSFFVTRIVVQLALVNYNGTTYDGQGRFTILNDEGSSLTYNESESTFSRLNYAIRVKNPTAIIGYEQGMTIAEMMALMLTGETAASYASDIAYVITGGTDGSVAHQIRLTSDWYQSINYTLVCDTSTIMVYPVLEYIGVDNSYSIPYSAASIAGANPSEYASNILNTLSMLVQFKYSGLSAEESLRWVDIRRDPDSTLYDDDCDYDRTIQLLFTGSAPSSINVGDVVALKMVYTESFYGGERNTTFETPEFWVRLYGQQDTLVKDKTTESLIDASGMEEKGISEAVGGLGNKEYYVADVGTPTARYTGDVDIVSADFILGGLASDNYSFYLILYDRTADATGNKPKLSLVFDGGSNPGYYVKLTSTAHADITSSKITSYEYYDENGEPQTRNVFDDVNLFDGKRHTVVAYIDKVGTPDLTTSEVDFHYDGMSNLTGYTCKVYYTVTFEIDNKYLYTAKYLGGTVTRNLTMNGTTAVYTSYSYTQYVDFNDADGSASTKVFSSIPGSVGFGTQNCTAQAMRFTLKKMGVGLSSGTGYVRNVHVVPSEEDAVLYVQAGNSVADVVRHFVVGSGDGYGDKVTYSYNYVNAVDGTIVGGVPQTAGLYLATVTAQMDNTVFLTRHFYVCVVSALEKAVSVTGTLVSHGASASTSAAYADSPLVLSHPTGGYAFTSTYMSSIEYTRLVFDYEVTGTEVNPASTIIVLKGRNNTKVDLSAIIEDEIYSGISLEIAQVFEAGTPKFMTTLHVRDDASYWKKELGTSIDWVGSGEKNVLIARYDKVNGIIDIRLVRGGALIFNERVMIGSAQGIGTGLSAANIRNIINAAGVNGMFTGFFMYNASMTLYELRMTEPQVAEYSLVDESGDVVDLDAGALTAGESYLVSDSYGVPIATSTKNIRFTFTATPTSNEEEGFYLMFYNNTPYFFGQDLDYLPFVTGDRGMILQVSKTGVYMSMYKYNVEWIKLTVLGGVNLLDGEEHTIVITVTDEETTCSTYNNVAGYVVEVRIDGGDMHEGFAPEGNNLNGITNLLGNDRDKEASDSDYSGKMDGSFLSANRYVGLYNVDAASIVIKEMILF